MTRAMNRRIALAGILTAALALEAGRAAALEQDAELAKLTVPHWGGELVVGAEAGDAQGVRLELYQPVGLGGAAFLASYGQVGRTALDAYDAERPVARFHNEASGHLPHRSPAQRRPGRGLPNARRSPPSRVRIRRRRATAGDGGPS